MKVSTTFDIHQLDPFQMCCLNLKVAPNWWEGRMVGSQKSISSPLIICFFASSLAKVSENFQVEGLNSYGRRQCVHTCDKTFSNMPTYKWQPPYNMLLGLRWQHWAVPVMCLANTKTKPVRNPSWKLQYRELTRQGPRLTLVSQTGERTPKKVVFQLSGSVSQSKKILH